MPIRPLEPSMSPDNLLDETPTEESEKKWHVVYTRARHEKSLARQLLTNHIAFYLPLVSKERYVRGRRQNSYLPLFNGYVFLYDAHPQTLRQLTSYCVSRILPVDDQQQLVADLRGIRSLITAGAPLTVERRLQPGQRVRVKSGPLSGLEGTIVRRNKNCRILVAVNYLQQGVSMEIDDFMVEPA